MMIRTFLPLVTLWIIVLKLICTSMRELLPNKKNWFGFVLCLCVGAVLAYIVGCAENTVALAAQTCDILFGVQLSIFLSVTNR